MSNFWQRAITGLVFVGVVLGAILWGEQSFVAMVFLINGFCLFEFFSLFRKLESKPNPILNVVLGTFFLAAMIMDVEYFYFILAPIFLVVFAQLFRAQTNIIESAGLLAFGLLYFVLPFSILVKSSFNITGYSPYMFVLPIIVLVWSNDTFAYIGGKLLGKHKLMSKVSPNKTIEGFVSGLLFASVASYLSYEFFPMSKGRINLELYHHLLIGIMVGTAATLGDLIQSSVKRMAGVKDSGKILPGHGGMWDRFDGLVLAIPAYAFVLWLIDKVL